MKTTSKITRLTTVCLSLVAALLGTTAANEQAAALITEGDRFDSRMDSESALKAYLQAETLRPEDPYLLIKIAKQYGESTVDAKEPALKLERSEEALEYSLRAVALDQQHADAHLAVAICYGRLLNQVPPRTKVEYSREVKRYTEQALSLDPKSDYAWHMLGRWHQGAANMGGLTKGIVKIVYGGLPPASLDDSAKFLEKAVALKPDRVSHHIELGRTYASMGRVDDARAAIEKGLALGDRERDDPNTKARGRETLQELEKKYN
jgi:tetratricopeptide (TPR) repeat protein